MKVCDGPEVQQKSQPDWAINLPRTAVACQATGLPTELLLSWFSYPRVLQPISIWVRKPSFSCQSLLSLWTGNDRIAISSSNSQTSAAWLSFKCPFSLTMLCCHGFPYIYIFLNFQLRNQDTDAQAGSSFIFSCCSFPSRPSNLFMTAILSAAPN